MLVTLSFSKAIWAILFAFVVVASQDEVFATVDCDEVTHGTDDIALLDVWAGVSSFSDGFSRQDYVNVREHAWIEWSYVAISLLSAVYGAAKGCTDFYNYDWTDWSFGCDLVVTAGPSCCPFSVSGKRKRDSDPRSGQGLDTAKLALQLGALVLLVENVTNLVDEDHLHGVFTSMDLHLLSGGMCLVSLWRLCDGYMGGCTGRERVFPCWEREDMASCLPPWNEEPAEVATGKIRDCLQPWQDTQHLAVEGNSRFTPEAPSDAVGSDAYRCAATRVGWCSLCGPDDAWMCGEGLKLTGDGRTWRVLSETKWKLKLFIDSRRAPVFLWIFKTEVNFSQRCQVDWPVFSIDGVAKAIRHTNFAPGDLFLDDRGPHAVVRPLSDLEKWQVMGLSDEKAQVLEGLGLSSELGQLAGNSITSKMADAVAAESASRISKFKQIVQARQRGRYILMQPVVGLQCAKLAATFLVILSLESQSILLWHGSEIPGMVSESTQQQSFKLACSWAGHLGVVDASSKSVLLERPMGNSRARSVICFPSNLRCPEGSQFIRVADVKCPATRELAVAAFAQVMRMKGVVDTSGLPVDGWQSGRVSGTAAYHPEVRDEPVSQDFLDSVVIHEAGQGKLSDLLSADGSQSMLDWMDRIAPVDLSDIPEALRQPVPKLEWCSELLPDPHIPVCTDWQELPPQQKLPKRPAPNGWLTAVRPKFRAEAARRVNSFSKKMTLWLNGECERPAITIIPGSWLEHWVFEAPHDFVSEPGWAVPIDVSKPSASHLNLNFLAQWGQGYPDQELVSFVALGVRYKADIPVQIVLQPHLMSFLPVQDKYLAEADRFVERGWTYCCVGIPIVPFFCASCGSVCRPLEPDRPRCTNDAGAPRQDTYDDDGVRVVPLNEAISESVWPKEVKPTALQVCIVMRVLLEAAQALGETVFVITDDYKSFFNQLRLSPSEYAKTGAAHPPRAGQERISFAFDTVLGFGIKMASNIAQRFADFIVHIFKTKLKPVMDAVAQKLALLHPVFGEWWSHRCSLGEGQAVLAAMLMYCDDPCILCVGADMTYEVLKLWTWITQSANTMMAIPEKRTLGISAKWIGIKFFTSFGLAVVPAQKVLRACGLMSEAMSSCLNFDQYRSLIGFLEHVKSVLFLRGDKMYGLYEPFSDRPEPIEMVTCSSLMWEQFARFQKRLLTQAGASVVHLEAFLSGRPLCKVNHSLSARRFAAFSDAAMEGTDKPGLGGWICGYVWRVPLSPDFLELHITTLEAIAAVVNVCAVHAVLGGTDHLPEDVCVECHVDAKSTADILIKGRARSPMLAFLHTLALQLPQFLAMLPFTIVMHCFGLGNLASDAASRGYDDVIRVVAECLGLKVIHLDLSAIALLLLRKCLEKHRQLGRQKHEHCWGRRGEVIGQAKIPGPETFVPYSRKRLRSQTAGTAGLQGPSGPLLQPVVEERGSSFVSHQRSRIASATADEPSGPQRSAGVYQAPQEPLQRPRVLGAVTARSLATALWHDGSDFAICTGDWDQLYVACEVALHTAGDAFALRTAQQDVGNWKSWSTYCDVMGTNPLRPPIDPVSDRLGYLREIVLLTNALTFFMRTKKGRSQLVIKPQSAMNILLGANRVLRQQHLSFIPLKALTLPLRGLMRKFMLKFGPQSLVPKRREPFTNGMVDSLASLADGSHLGPLGPLDHSSIVGKSWVAAITVSTSAGFRKAEMFQSNAETFFLTWSLVSWYISGSLNSQPTDGQLMSLKHGDYLVLAPPPSKSDQFNIAWGSHPIYLAFHQQQRNAARAVRDLALAVGQQHRQRPRAAVFVDNNREPLKAAAMVIVLHNAVASLVGNERAKLFSWHSGRIFLCTALHAAGVKPAIIQAMLRWQTDESMRAYNRMSMQQYGQNVDLAARSVIAAVQTPNMPIYEQFDFFLALNEATEELEHDGSLLQH